MKTRDTVGCAMIGLVISVALIRSSTPPSRFPPVNHEQAREFYFRAIDKEAGERQAGVKKFRSSPWSQDDEFHNKEAKVVREYAKGHRVSVSSVVEALDRGMHEHWPTPPNKNPDQTILPCRPRLSY